MSRIAVLAVVIAALPPACSKLLGKKDVPVEDPVASADPTPTPTPLPTGTGTTPPIWQNPSLTPSATTSATAVASADPPNADLTKAQAAFDAKDFKKAKTILQKRVTAGKCVAEEVTLLNKACQQLKDKTCLSDTKKSCPPVVPSEHTSNDPLPKNGL